MLSCYLAVCRPVTRWTVRLIHPATDSEVVADSLANDIHFSFSKSPAYFSHSHWIH